MRTSQIIIIGIDRSSAFDTIERGKLMQVLETLLQEDEQRMCRLLLTLPYQLNLETMI